MSIARILLFLGLGLLVSACSALGVPTRNSAFEQLPDSAVVTPPDYEALDSGAQTVASAAPLNAIIPPERPAFLDRGEPLVTVKDIVVRVPRTLKVSEANRYLPRGDIVWRGDPPGDRYDQVQAIFETAMARGARALDGPAVVNLEIEVKRFHALTEKARYTTGGVHAITFDLALKDPETGKLLMPVRTIRADLEAFGGKQALQADAEGQTQKVRITDHLAKVIRQELTDPEGYRNASLGFFQMLNNI